jgi:DNA-binding phage protein
MRIEDCQNLLNQAENAILEAATLEDDEDFCQHLLSMVASVKNDWASLAALVLRLAVSGTTAEPNQATLLQMALSDEKNCRFI